MLCFFSFAFFRVENGFQTPIFAFAALCVCVSLRNVYFFAAFRRFGAKREIGADDFAFYVEARRPKTAERLRADFEGVLREANCAAARLAFVYDAREYAALIRNCCEAKAAMRRLDARALNGSLEFCKQFASLRRFTAEIERIVRALPESHVLGAFAVFDTPAKRAEAFDRARRCVRYAPLRREYRFAAASAPDAYRWEDFGVRRAESAVGALRSAVAAIAVCALGVGAFALFYAFESGAIRSDFADSPKYAKAIVFVAAMLSIDVFGRVAMESTTRFERCELHWQSTSSAIAKTAFVIAFNALVSPFVARLAFYGRSNADEFIGEFRFVLAFLATSAAMQFLFALFRPTRFLRAIRRFRLAARARQSAPTNNVLQFDLNCAFEDSPFDFIGFYSVCVRDLLVAAIVQPFQPFASLFAIWDIALVSAIHRATLCFGCRRTPPFEFAFLTRILSLVDFALLVHAIALIAKNALFASLPNWFAAATTSVAAANLLIGFAFWGVRARRNWTARNDIRYEQIAPTFHTDYDRENPFTSGRATFVRLLGQSPIVKAQTLGLPLSMQPILAEILTELEAQLKVSQSDIIVEEEPETAFAPLPAEAKAPSSVSRAPAAEAVRLLAPESAVSWGRADGRPAVSFAATTYQSATNSNLH